VVVVVVVDGILKSLVLGVVLVV
jgi:hypothetical protein